MGIPFLLIADIKGVGSEITPDCSETGICLRQDRDPAQLRDFERSATLRHSASAAGDAKVRRCAENKVLK